MESFFFRFMLRVYTTTSTSLQIAQSDLSNTSNPLTIRRQLILRKSENRNITSTRHFTERSSKSEVLLSGTNFT